LIPVAIRLFHATDVIDIRYRPPYTGLDLAARFIVRLPGSSIKSTFVDWL
jgi:hypothetical protein